jgi:anhydro-N-acetylmuramic acid kinase
VVVLYRGAVLAAGEEPVLSIGLMSGTSVDGSVSAALLRTDGAGVVERLGSLDHVYEPPDGPRPIHHLMKAGELAARRANGDMAVAAQIYPCALRQHVEATFRVGNTEVEGVVTELVRAFHPARRPVELDDLVRRSTLVHADAARALLDALDRSPAAITCVGYHGQTLFHAPLAGVTVQIGDAQLLADRLGIPVVFDLRSADVAAGGHGAPLAPIYHHALAHALRLDRAAILNLGGTANVTVVGPTEEDLVAFDTGPANGLLDRFVLHRAGEPYDADSRHAWAGRVDPDALEALLARGIATTDGRDFLEAPPPKSLDIRDYTYELPEFARLGLEDGCATLNAFAAECVARGVALMTAAGVAVPTEWILCGGGTRNSHLCAQLALRLGDRIGPRLRVQSADQIGWSAMAMEAEAFAYLAVRSIRGRPITFPRTTGARAGGGRLVHPQPPGDRRAP